MTGGDAKPLLRRLAWLGLLGLTTLWAKSAATSRATEPRTAGPRGAAMMSHAGDRQAGETQIAGSGGNHHVDRGPGEEHPAGEDVASGIRGYAIGLGLAALLTVLSFSLPGNSLIWGPAIPAALIVFAIAQMGVHLVFFLHLTTGPDNTNNAMALAFGCIVVLLLLGGSLWIMWHLNHNMAPMSQMMDMQR